MKYMGSKRWMLRNGLGKMLLSYAAKADRFIDLFSGSGAVVSFVARQHDILVLAYDLQEFGAVVARSIIGRNRALDAQKIWKKWVARAEGFLPNRIAQFNDGLSKKKVLKLRKWCAKQTDYPVTRAYG